MDIAATLNLVDNEYHAQTSEEDLPPPPSPVSSSYSELRRATDNTSYPSMPNYPMSQNNYQQLNVSMGKVRNSDIGGADVAAGINDGMSGSHHLMQQSYANNYQPEYGTYVPSSQVIQSMVQVLALITSASMYCTYFGLRDYEL